MHKQIAAFAAVLALSCPALATVTGTATSTTYTCTGAVTVYTIPFPYLAASHVVATQKTTAGVVTTVFGAVKPSIAPVSGTLTLGTACPSGSTLTISRSVPFTQPQSFRTGSYSGATHEQALDRLEMQIQQLNAKEVADLGVVNNTVAAFNASGAAIGSTTSVLATGSTTPRTLAARAADVTNVKDFGAKGDGLTDDTAAIQAAITQAAASGGTVLFPAGNYIVSRAGTNQWALTNTGAPSLRLVGQAGAKLTMASDISTTQIALGYFFGVKKMEVTGLDISITVTGNPATRIAAYIFNFSPDGSGNPCNDVWVHGNTLTITHALGNTEVRAIFGTYFYGGEANGPTWAQSRFSFTDNFIHDMEGRGVETWNAEKVIVSRNRFVNMAPIMAATVIRMIGAVREVQVADNYVELAASANSGTAYGIVWGSGSSANGTWTPTKSDIGTFVNNTIIAKGGDVSNNQVGIYCQGGQRASFIGNTIIQKNNVNFSGTGIRFDADPNAGSCTDLAFISNRIAGWNVFNVFENDAGSARIQFAHNIFGGPSAAAEVGQDKDISDSNSTLDLSQANWSSLLSAWTYGTAKTRRLNGAASPQNSVVGTTGDTFTDATNGDLWWKGSGTSTNNGWLKQASTTGVGTTVTAGSTIAVTKDSFIIYSANSASPVTASATTAIASGSFIGQLMWLQGTSATNTITIPHNANTRLDGSASITLGLFDAILLEWNGTAWIEMVRKHAGSVAIPGGGSTTIGAGVGSVKMSSANAATNTAWIPITYAGTTYFVPAWTTNSP